MLAFGGSEQLVELLKKYRVAVRTKARRKRDTKRSVCIGECDTLPYLPASGSLSAAKHTSSWNLASARIRRFLWKWVGGRVCDCFKGWAGTTEATDTFDNVEEDNNEEVIWLALERVEWEMSSSSSSDWTNTNWSWTGLPQFTHCEWLINELTTNRRGACVYGAHGALRAKKEVLPFDSRTTPTTTTTRVET